MTADTVEEQLVKYLRDAHGIEVQALAQMRTAPKIAGDEELERIFREHLEETETQEQLVRERLEAHGEKPSRIEDAVMAAGGKGFVLFARSQPDTPGKLTAHAYSYEHLELGAYEVLARVAERAGDSETVDVAHRIRDEERAMGERLEQAFDRAVDASLEAVGAEDDPGSKLGGYLADAHALENQSIQLLERGPKIGGHPDLEKLYAEHLEETRTQQRMVDSRLEALGAGPSTLKDAAMRLGALNWGTFFQTQPDTAGKLAVFAYAFEHLEVGGYELLARVADRAGDAETATTARRIADQERAMAGRIAVAFDRATDASLRETVGV